MPRWPALLALVFLSGCGVVGNGRCDIPSDEAQIHRSIVLGSLRRGFQSDHVVGISPEEYLRRNPGCCEVRRASVSTLDWLLMDRYSLAKYEARAAYAYRDGPSVMRRVHHGKADSCGRIPDEFGQTEVVAGPTPPSPCVPRPAAPGEVAMCVAPPAPPHDAVSIAEAQRLYRLKIEAMRSR